MTSADHAVVASTRALISAVERQAGLAYANDMWSPISDITLQIIARKMGAALVEQELPALVEEMALPPLFGPPILAINTAKTPGMRRVALRHGLAHLLAGELEPEQGGEIRMMSSAFDDMTLEERRADLFAIADLIPDRELEQLRQLEYSADEMFWWVWVEITRYVKSAWSPFRIRDRAQLRLALWTGVA